MSVNNVIKSPAKSRNSSQIKKSKRDDKENIDIQQEKENFPFDEDDDFDFSDFNIPSPQKLDLSDWQKCKVVDVQRDPSDSSLVLKVHAENSGLEEAVIGETSCRLQGTWSHTTIETNDVVYLQAVWEEKLKCFTVNAEHGFCVVHPDILIPTTTVVGSLFCTRKTVLQGRFRGIDANSKVMVIGSLVHELLQLALQNFLVSYTAIEKGLRDLLKYKETVHTLYGSLMSSGEAYVLIEKYIPNISAFMQQYICAREPNVIRKDMFQGVFKDIEDIEENIWAPKLGLKGKIDVSVTMQRRRYASYAKKFPVPLELKTTRPTFSNEHKGQVMLYQMMLNSIGRKTESGLLLYLSDNSMREIKCTRNDQRDLIMLRNELSQYMKYKAPAEETRALNTNKLVHPFALPAPISNYNACSACSYATLCSAFVHTDPELQLSDGHPLHRIMEESIAHLHSKDYEYFLHWCNLLSLEEKEVKKSNPIRSLWTESPESRQQSGRAIVGLKMTDDMVREASRYLHTFRPKASKDEEIDLTLSGFSIGEYVIVSTTKRVAIASGLIFDLTKDSISVNVERSLLLKYWDEIFIVDKHESSSMNVFNFTNLSQLLSDTKRATELRNIVIHGKEPAFTKLLPQIVAPQYTEVLNNLNDTQREAVLKALRAESYMLLKGLPGTGKTQTIVGIVRILHLMGKTVLITSHTNSAVDNLLVRLIEYNIPMIRLGSYARINPKLQPYSESELLKDYEDETELEQKYASFSIVGVTCYGVTHSIFLHRKFDYCIVDESTQVMQPTILRPLMFCNKFILVGDPDQLPPLIRSREGRERGADVSLFQHLDSKEATAILSVQYRMNGVITKLANNLTYEGRLECATRESKMGTINFVFPAIMREEKWLQRIMHHNVDQSVVFLNTSDCSEMSSNFARSVGSSTCTAIEQKFTMEPIAIETVPQLSPTRRKIPRIYTSKYTNYSEAAVIFHLLKCLLIGGYPADRIGVIAPYRAQVELLRKLMEQHQMHFESQTPGLNYKLIEVNTVDQYQGRDKDIIIYSCTKTGPCITADLERSREAEILEDKRRLTVAITRAKYKLILVGDAAYLEQYTPFKRLLSNIRKNSKFDLYDGNYKFNWKALLDELSEVMSRRN